MLRYFAGCLVGVFATLAGLGVLYWGVGRYGPQYLPPPAISRLEQLDDKLRFLRQRPFLDPQILAVGSSITWRQLDGRELVSPGEEFRFFNGGTAFLKAHQTGAMLDWYLRRYRHIETVVHLTALPDFDDCSSTPARLFDPADATAYAFESAPEWPFYLKYFTPLRYARTGRNYPRDHAEFVGGNWLDPFGSSPLHLPGDRNDLHYGPLTNIDSACLESIAQMAAELAARGTRFIVVFAPVNPEYRIKYPQSDLTSRALVERVTSVVAPHGTLVINAYDDPRFTRADFFDAFHLQDHAVRRLSKHIASLTSPALKDEAQVGAVDP